MWLTRAECRSCFGFVGGEMIKPQFLSGARTQVETCAGPPGNGKGGSTRTAALSVPSAMPVWACGPMALDMNMSVQPPPYLSVSVALASGDKTMANGTGALSLRDRST
uniref:Uncharacterized protein n=1 Tax=Panagrellus redivivus TaxID=6233 RepID=A0A7E4VN58_PANRE